MRKDNLQGAPSGTGSCPSDHAAARHGRAGFDPSRLATNLLNDLAGMKAAAAHIAASPAHAIIGWKVEMQDGFRGISFMQSVEGILSFLASRASDERPTGPRPSGLGAKPASAIAEGEALEDYIAGLDVTEQICFDKLKRENKELREALRPFAKAGELFAPRAEGEWDQLVYGPAAGREYSICGDDLRRARTLLSRSSEEGNSK